MRSNWKWNLLAAVVALTAATATASAQDISLPVNVPFTFSINTSANLAAGDYILSRHAGVWRFTSADFSETVPIVNYVSIYGESYANPTLTFACAHSHCQLRAIHLGEGRNGAEVPAPNLSKSDRKELAVVNVPLKQKRAE
jgi:hypothetical protein